MIVEKGHFHFAEKYWDGGGGGGRARPPWPPLFRRSCLRRIFKAAELNEVAKQKITVS